MTIKIEIDKDFKKALTKTVKFLDKSKRKDIMSEMQLAIVGLSQEHFENSESPEGHPWLESFRAIIDNGKTLRDTSALFRSIGSNNKLGDDFFTIGTNLSYAEIHEDGSSGMPQRNYMFNKDGSVPDKYVKEIDAILEYYLNK